MLEASDHERQVIAYDIHDGLAQQLAAAIMQFQVYEQLREQDPGKAKTAYDAGVAMVQQAHGESRRLISGVRPPVLDVEGVASAIAHLVHEQRKGKELEIEYHDDVKLDRLPPILENAIYRIAQEALENACRQLLRLFPLQRVARYNGKYVNLAHVFPRRFSCLSNTSYWVRWFGRLL